jgi:hypothetical protein
VVLHVIDQLLFPAFVRAALTVGLLNDTCGVDLDDRSRQ